MSDEKTSKPTHVVNPNTGRLCKAGGKTHRKLLSDGVLNKTRGDSNVIATGTTMELEIMRNKLLESGALDLKGEKLKIVGNKLVKVRKKLRPTDVSLETKNQVLQTIMEKRRLMNSKLTDDQLYQVLNKILDAKILGKPICVEEEYLKMLELNTALPNIPEEKSEEKSEEPPLPEEIPKRKKNRFRVAPIPSYDSTTEFETEFESDLD